MIKALGYIVLVLSLAIYLLSSSTELTEKLAAWRSSSTSILRSDKYRYGDLYGMSYLPEYRIPVAIKPTIELSRCTVPQNTRLYAIADSYMFVFANHKKYYCGVDSLMSVRLSHAEKLNGSLDLQKNNKFLLEVAERSLRSVLADTSYLANLIDEENEKQEKKPEGLTFRSIVSRYLFNKSIDTNLELNIWEFSFFTFIKEFKANLNYKLFNVVDKSVAISPDKKYLLYKPTIDTTTNLSAFQFVPDSEIASMVKNLNHLYRKAKGLGFSEVYLSIIPSPVSVLYPEYNGLKYNRLLSRIQNSPGLEMKVVDIYTPFQNSKINVYLHSDTHWNVDGAHLWLNQLNGIMTRQEDLK